YDAAGPNAALIDVDGTCSAMMLQRGSMTNGAYHASVTGVGSGCHRYYFVFHDAADAVVTYPTTGSLGIGAAGSCPDWDTTRPALGTGCDAVAATPDAGSGGGGGGNNADAGPGGGQTTTGRGCKA